MSIRIIGPCLSFLVALVGCQTTHPNAADVLHTADLQTSKLAETLDAIDQAFAITSENIANADTTAFKATRIHCDGTATPVCELDIEQGRLENTGRPLDLAIEGNGFFKLCLGKPGTGSFGYTRNGTFFVDDKGRIVLGAEGGHFIEPPIQLPVGVTELCIGEDGMLSYVKAGSTRRIAAGQIELWQFMNPEGLNRFNDGIYAATDESGTAMESNPSEIGAGKVIQGFLEESNVSINREMLRLQFLKNWREAILRGGRTGGAPTSIVKID